MTIPKRFPPRSGRLQRAAPPTAMDVDGDGGSPQTCWRQFLSFIDDRMQSRWVFRGVPSAAYECKPSVGRSSSYDPKYEVELFELFKREAKLHMAVPAATEWDWLALGQHYGLPTRLLDWSTNPLIACFFATALEPENTDALIYSHALQELEIVDPKKAPSPFALDKVGFILPSALAPRIASQRGIFSVHPAPAFAWTSSTNEKDKFLIPVEARALFQRNLFRLGVDAGHIWGTLEGLCQSLRWQYKNRLGLGAIV